MKKDRELQQSIKGMNRDSAPFNLSKEEYSFALNANFHNENGNGGVVIQNEPSNIKCTGFKDGYKVVGHKYFMNRDITFFFLHNPTLNISEIGYISSFFNDASITPNENIDLEGNVTVVLEEPLENQIQTSSCEYTTLISDYCDIDGVSTGCLNFSIEHPIHESNIQIKDEKTGAVIYFTDGVNPQRYLQIDNLDFYLTDKDNCSGEVVDTCFNCEKLRVFPLFNKPCLQPLLIQNGGNLKAGVYEALIAYCDFSGNERTDYYSITNPIPIFDKGNRILDQTLLDYETNYAIKIDVSDIDSRFDFYKIVVIYRSGLDSSVTNFVNGIYPYDQNSVTIHTLKDKSKIPTIDIISRRPIYTKAKGFTEGNGYLFQYGLTQQRTINLQPIVNFIGSFARWITADAKENLYEDGVFVSLYEGYMRGEVYPFALKFFMDGGYDLPLTTLIARPPTLNEVSVLNAQGSNFSSNNNTDSILSVVKDCYGNERNKRWQFEDTSTIDDDICLSPNNSFDSNTEIKTIEFNCTISDSNNLPIPVATIGSGIFSYDSNINIVTYINSNIQSIINSTGSNGADIRNILLHPEIYQNCTPEIDDNCKKHATLINEEMFAISVDEEIVSEVSSPLSSYSDASAPSSCLNMYASDPVSGAVPYNDTSFVSNYMISGEIVNKRIAPTNVSCGQSVIANNFLPTNGGGINPFWLDNKGVTGSSYSSLLTSLVTNLGEVDFIIILNGNSGSANITIGSNVYPISYSGSSLTNTATGFVTANASTILTNDNLTVTSSGSNLIFSGNFIGFPSISISNVTLNLNGVTDRYMFTNNVHSNAVWFKVDFSGKSKKIFQLSPNLCINGDNNSKNKLRISVFANCSASTSLPLYTKIVDDTTLANDINKIIELDSVDFGGVNSTAYIAIDSVLRTRIIPSSVTSNTLMPPCGCLFAYSRDVETIKEVNYTNLTFGKRQIYTSECSYKILIPNDCSLAPSKKGKFSYWESVEKYPCNEHLWDSSKLIVPKSYIPSEYQQEFENYYVSSTQGGNYVLNTETNFMDKPIRHYKFPDSTKVPFMGQEITPFRPTTIKPIGFFIPKSIINAFLDVAVLNNLITIEERNKINKYEVFRGDRRIDKSIIAKGLLFDMYKYFDLTGGKDVYYPNYPLNSLGSDMFNSVYSHKYNDIENDFFTFHSPNIHFNKPTLPKELLIEGYVYGHAKHLFDEVMGHPTYVILGKTAHNVAAAIAGIEVALESMMQVVDLMIQASQSDTYQAALAWVAFGIGIAQVIIEAISKASEYILQWEQTFYDLGQPYQFAYYQAAVGFYNNFKPNTLFNDKLRGLSISSYVNDGRWSLVDEVITNQEYNLNMVDREDAVAIKTSKSTFKYPSNYINYDNRSSNQLLSSRKNYNGVGKNYSLVSNAASPYVALKQYLPAQYGEINSIKWIHTGHCGDLKGVDNCDMIFGGDTYISRFSVKRKLPYFLNNALGLAPLTPFKYSDYFNINPPFPFMSQSFAPPRFFVDYKFNDESDTLSGLFIPRIKSVVYLDSIGGDTSGMFYVKPPNKFYLYSYGIPYFLVESDINCNYRYSKRELHERFYPEIGDVSDWTQELKNSIRNPNTYFYNFTYSQGHTFYPYDILPSNYSPDVYDKINNLNNAVIYSKQDVSENSTSDPWLIYKANDLFNFETQFGQLISLESIESEQMLGRFVNGFSIFGSVDLLRDRLTEITNSVGSGGIFSGRTVNFNKTQLGYAGTQHVASISCDFGHFWVDAKRGKVFQLSAGGKQLDEISRSSDVLNSGCEKWFKEELPLKIQQYTNGLSLTQMDNGYNGIGIVMGWDDRLKRLFITKRDYIPKGETCFRDGSFYDANEDNYNLVISSHISSGYDYLGIDNCRLKFKSRKGDDYVYVFLNKIEIGDLDYFEDCSWTIGYSPLLKSWISYYSFKPDYYISYNSYFQTGINTGDSREFGLWSHLPFLSSYQVFYGKKYPFTIDYVIPTSLSNSILECIEYYLDVRKYYNKYNFVNRVGVGFNKAIIYNDHQNTGLLNLIVQDINDIRQNIFFPQHNINSVDILQTEINNKYSFNYLYNVIKDERAGMPIFISDNSNITKVLDDRLLDYRYIHKDRLRGDYFRVRLTNDKETRFKFLFRLSMDDRAFYLQ